MTLPRKVLFVGLGGAGQRHLRILSSLLPKSTQYCAYRARRSTPLLKPDFSVDASNNLEEAYNLECHSDLDRALDSHPDLVVISNPTSLHYKTAAACVQRGITTWVEKPFASDLNGFEHFSETVLKNRVPFYMLFQRRFHPQLVKIKQILAKGILGSPTSATFQVGSYVPQWHPYEDFRELYACRKDLGGGVLLTEIHEIDLIAWYFGLPKDILAMGGNYSGVSLDVEDTVGLMLRYPRHFVQLSASFMQKTARRNISIAFTDGFVEWNGISNELMIVNHRSGESTTEKENLTPDTLFQLQAKHLLSRIDEHDPDQLKIAHDSLFIVDAAKKNLS